MLYAYMPFLIALVGLLMMALSKNGVVTKAGEILFFCGVFFVVQSVSGRTGHLF